MRFSFHRIFLLPPRLIVARIDDAERPRRTDGGKRGMVCACVVQCTHGDGVQPTTDRPGRSTAANDRRHPTDARHTYIRFLFCLSVCWWCDSVSAAVSSSLSLAVALSITKKHALLPCTAFTWLNSAKCISTDFGRTAWLSE